MTTPRPPLLALIAFLLALALRLLNVGSAFAGGLPRMSPVDELYHAKRMTYSAAHFPRVLGFDPDRGTRGAWCPWPPLYDLAAGGYARLLGASSTIEVMARVTWLPPLLFALFVAWVTFVAARAGNTLAAALAGLALATSPFLVDFSSIGSIDHHYLEPALTFAIVFALIRLLRGGSGSGVLLGVAMVTAMFVQTALLLACAIAFGILFFAPLMTQARNARSDDAATTPYISRNGAIAFGILTLLVTLYAATRPAGYPPSAWFLGWPHAGIFAAATVALLLRVRRFPAVLALLAGLAVIAATPYALEALAGGSRFLGGDPWLGTIAEFIPILTQPRADLVSDLVLLSGGVILVWPLAARAWRTRDLASLTIALFGILYLLMALSSRRFRPQAITLLALAGAIEAGHWFATRRRSIAILAILLVALPPSLYLLFWLRHDNDSPVTETQLPWIRAAAFLQQQSPGGRVLAPWSMGHALDVIGERPVILDNFGSMPDAVDFQRANDALLAKDERALASYCDANNIRWIVFINPMLALPDAAAINSLDPNQFIEKPANEPARIHRSAEATCAWRAYYYGGAAMPGQGMFGLPLTRFRKVYTDPQPAWHGVLVSNGPALQIWERK